jgi:hypothetical protein
METKNFNRKFFCRELYGGICLVLLISVAFVVYAIASGYWNVVGTTLLVLALVLMLMMGIFNREGDIIVDYVKREVRSNIKFDENKEICIPFDAIVNVYIYNADQLKRVLKLKKYPAKTLVIEKTYSKEYISLQFFDEDTIHALIKELQKARGFA